MSSAEFVSVARKTGSLRFGQSEWIGQVKFCLNDRFVDLPQELFRSRRVDANHNPVGMKKILNRRTFTQKLRIRGNVIAQTVSAVDREMPLQLSAGLDRYRALFDHQAIARRTFCDRSRDTFNGGKVGVAVRKRRRSHTDEDRVSPRNRLFGGPEAQPASLSDALDHVLQVWLKQRHDAILQFGEFFDVAFTAENVVADLGQTSSGRQTYITRAND